MDVDAAEDQLRRLAELDNEIEAGEFAAEDAVAARAALERAIVDAIPNTGTTAAASRRGVLVVIVLIAFGAALPLYDELGDSKLARFALENPEVDLSKPDNAVELLLDQVRERTREVPEDRQAWTILARSELQLGRYEAALTAAERAHALAPDDADGTLLLIDALAMRDGGSMGERARELLAQVRKSHPKHPTALVLDGIIAQQDGDAAIAAQRWQQALALLPPDAPFRQELEGMLAGVAGLAPSAAPPAMAGSVDVLVRVAPELADRIPPDGALFVVARAADGSAPPLAVSRHATDEVPLEVRLDDGMAMVPGRALGNFEAAYVLARLSASGQARSAPGDLQGRSDVFDPRTAPRIELVIDKVVGE